MCLAWCCLFQFFSKAHHYSLNHVTKCGLRNNSEVQDHIVSQKFSGSLGARQLGLWSDERLLGLALALLILKSVGAVLTLCGLPSLAFLLASHIDVNDSTFELGQGSSVSPGAIQSGGPLFFT